MVHFRRVLGAVLLCGSTGSVAAAADLDALLTAVKGVGSEGAGNAAASRAWRELAAQGPASLPAILAAFDDASPLSRNWLQAAVDTIAERALKQGELPTAKLEAFVRDQERDSKARYTAYQWLTRGDETASQRLVPGMLHDPGVEFRREAVTRLLDEADKLFGGEKAGSTQLVQRLVYRQALDAARDDDQIKVAVKKLRDLGDQVDLPRHFGFLMHWKVIGPFPNKDRGGYATEYPPEREVDLDAAYEGSKGEARWIDYATSDDYGMVDLNQPYGALKEELAYAFTEFTSAVAQDVELRLGCKNAWKVWLNGDLIFARDEYHRGMRLDQYRMKVSLKPGPNRILLKVCQNEQTQPWTKEWQFQIRVCDATGTAILAQNRPPTPAAKDAEREE